MYENKDYKLFQLFLSFANYYSFKDENFIKSMWKKTSKAEYNLVENFKKIITKNFGKKRSKEILKIIEGYLHNFREKAEKLIEISNTFNTLSHSYSLSDEARCLTELKENSIQMICAYLALANDYDKNIFQDVNPDDFLHVIQKKNGTVKYIRFSKDPKCVKLYNLFCIFDRQFAHQWFHRWFKQIVSNIEQNSNNVLEEDSFDLIDLLLSKPFPCPLFEFYDVTQEITVYQKLKELDIHLKGEKLHLCALKCYLSSASFQLITENKNSLNGIIDDLEQIRNCKVSKLIAPHRIREYYHENLTFADLLMGKKSKPSNSATQGKLVRPFLIRCFLAIFLSKLINLMFLTN